MPTPAQTQRPSGGETTRVNLCATLAGSTSNCTESIDHRRKRTRAFDPGSVDSYFDDFNKMTPGACPPPQEEEAKECKRDERASKTEQSQAAGAVDARQGSGAATSEEDCDGIE